MCVFVSACVCVFDMGGNSREYFVHRINIDTNQSKGPIDLCECNGSSAAVNANFDCTLDVDVTF